MTAAANRGGERGMMPKFVKRPVVIDAEKIQDDILIRTFEGDMIGRAGDWLVTGIKGEQYPVKPDIFETSYRPYPTDEDGNVISANAAVQAALFLRERAERAEAQLSARTTERDALLSRFAGMQHIFAASIKKITAGLKSAGSGQYQNYPAGVIELGIVLDALDMLKIDLAPYLEWPKDIPYPTLEKGAKVVMDAAIKAALDMRQERDVLAAQNQDMYKMLETWNDWFVTEKTQLSEQDLLNMTGSILATPPSAAAEEHVEGLT